MVYAFVDVLEYCQDFLTKNFYKFLLNSLTHALHTYWMFPACQALLNTEASSKA